MYPVGGKHKIWELLKEIKDQRAPADRCQVKGQNLVAKAKSLQRKPSEWLT